VDNKLENILLQFGIAKSYTISQIYKNSAWSVNDTYILKSNENQGELDKSVMLNRLLLAEGVPVVEYIGAVDGSPYVSADRKYWSLMKKIKGTVFDPFIGGRKQNGMVLGKTVAGLHRAFVKIQDKVKTGEADFSNELSSWIVPELEKHRVSFKNGVMDSLYTFFEHDYRSLPRQLIHRDMHTSNLLFDNGALTGYLDFDLSNRNIRVFDLVYLGCSQLVDNYKDETRLAQWCEIFAGIIQGYAALLPLSEEELKAIPRLFIFDNILFTAFFLKNNQPEAAKKCGEMTNWLYDNMEMIQKICT